MLQPKVPTAKTLHSQINGKTSQGPLRLKEGLRHGTEITNGTREMGA